MTIEILAKGSGAGPRAEGDEAEVDVCTSCGGVWVDWFDGEVRMVAAEVLAGEAARASRSSGGPGSALRNEAYATGACPRCTRQLVVERYVLPPDGAIASRRSPGERPSLGQQTGADLLRCEECAGVFVSRASAELLSVLPAGGDPPPSSTGTNVNVDPLPWRKFMSVVRRFLRLD
ncbi:MAG: zf-TFIIB domain-containing protein [Labilithrix sp.]|nr:zf-TFIIB domain-containing protein [Labilithrix sp.]